MQDKEVVCPSWQPAGQTIVTNQSHTYHGYSHHKAVHLNMAPSSLRTTPTQELPHTATAEKLAATSLDLFLK